MLFIFELCAYAPQMRKVATDFSQALFDIATRPHIPYPRNTIHTHLKKSLESAESSNQNFSRLHKTQNYNAQALLIAPKRNQNLPAILIQCALPKAIWETQNTTVTTDQSPADQLIEQIKKDSHGLINYWDIKNILAFETQTTISENTPNLTFAFELDYRLWEHPTRHFYTKEKIGHQWVPLEFFLDRRILELYPKNKGFTLKEDSPMHKFLERYLQKSLVQIIQ